MGAHWDAWGRIGGAYGTKGCPQGVNNSRVLQEMGKSSEGSRSDICQ